MRKIAKKDYSRIKKLNLKNLKREKLTPGTYRLLNKNRKPIYVGVSKKVQHRLFAVLYGRSDYVQVRGKMRIKKASRYYQTLYTSVNNSRKIEKNDKKYKHKSSKKK